MARDYTKYQVDGIDGVFGKGKLVLAVVQDYCSKNECSFDELKAVFPDEAQAGNTGVFGTLEEAKEIAKKRARHYVKEPIKLSDTKIAVSNQWGDNLPLFIETAKGLGYNISVAGETSAEEETDGNTNEEEFDVDDFLESTEELLKEASADEQSDVSTNEDDSEKTFNTAEAITVMYRLMLGMDGEFSEDEAVKLVELVTPYAEYVEEELKTVVNNALELYNSNTFEQNFEFAMTLAASLKETASHEICIRIGKDLATLAWADGELHDNETKYWSQIIGAMGVSADEVYGENEEASADEETEDQYPFLPSSWGVEHVVVIPLRDSMLADGKVDQMEHNHLAHFFENFGQIGVDCYEVWDEVDDQLQKFEKIEKIAITIKQSAAKYLKDHMDDEYLSKLIHYMAEMVCNDDVIQYREYVILRFYLDQWYSQAIDDYMGKFKAAGMTVITSPDN